MTNFSGVSELTDEDLVKNIKENNCSLSLKELSERHAGLCYSIIKSHLSQLSGVSTDGMFDRDDLVYQVVKKYDASKGGKFTTFLGNGIKFFCQSQTAKLGRYYHCDDKELEFLIDNSNQINHKYINNEEQVKFIFYILDQLKDKRIKQIFKLRYFSDEKKKRSWAAIAKELSKRKKISIQGIINLHDSALVFLKEKLKSEQCLDIV